MSVASWLLAVSLVGLALTGGAAAADEPVKRALPGYAASGVVKARFSFRPIPHRRNLYNRTSIRQVLLPEECNKTVTSLKPPQFLMVSCPKCGTTALYHGAICPHQHFNCPAKKKDNHWFATKNAGSGVTRLSKKYYDKYIHRNFVKKFQKTRVENGTVVHDDRVVVDAGVYYYMIPKALANIKAALPCVKTLWVLRNPLARARSQYYDHIITRQWSLTPPNRNPTKDNIYTLSEMLRPELEAMERCQMKTGIGAGQGLRSPWHACMREQDPSLPSRALSGKTSLTLLRTGLYHHHVQNWMKAFPASSFHFVDYEDIKRDPWAVLDGMLEYLDMPAENSTALRGEKLKNIHPVGVNTRNARIGWRDVKEDVPPAMLMRLGRVLEPHNEALFSLLGRRFSWQAGSLQ